MHRDSNPIHPRPSSHTIQEVVDHSRSKMHEICLVIIHDPGVRQGPELNRGLADNCSPTELTLLLSCSFLRLSPSPSSLHPYTPNPGSGGGGGHCLAEGRYPKQNYRPPVLCYHSPLSLSLLVYSPLFLRHEWTAYCYYCC